MKIYIVNTEWYSADQGDFPNTQIITHGIYSQREKAVDQFSELYKLNEVWSFGHKTANILEGRIDEEYIEKNITEEVLEELKTKESNLERDR